MGSIIAAVVFFLVPVIKMPDTAGYLKLADWIVGKASRDDFLWFSHRTPGYPLVIVISGGTVFRSLVTVKIVQLIMAVLTPILLYRIGSYFSRFIAYYAALFYLIPLIPFAYSTVVYTETSFIFFLCLSICLAFEYLESGKARYLLLLIPSVWFMSMIRYGMPYMVIFFVLALKQWKRLPYIAAALSIVIGLFAGWSAFRSGYSGLPFSITDITNASYRFALTFFYTNSRAPLDESDGPATARLISITRKYVLENWNDRKLQDTAGEKLLTPEARFLYFDRFKGDLPGFADNVFKSPTDFYDRVIQESVKKEIGLAGGNELYKRVFFEWIKKHPVEALHIFALSFLKHFIPLPVADRSVDFVFLREPEFGIPLTIRTIKTRSMPVRWLSICAGVVFMFLRPILGIAMLAGFLTMIRTRKWPGALLLFLMIMVQVAQFSVFSAPLTRFIFHTLPMEMVLGVIGAAWFCRWIAQRGEFFKSFFDGIVVKVE